jgi:guanylate kinase
VLLEIELRGAWQVLAQMPDALMIFISPPSLEELECRLRGRNTESDESIRARLARACEEMAEVQAEMGPGGRHRFDYVIVNDTVQRASDELARVIQESRDSDEQAYDR